jgi:hypothetical protein
MDGDEILSSFIRIMVNGEDEEDDDDDRPVVVFL